MYEDKQLICDLLLQALQRTSALYDLLALEYDPSSETVTATFPAGRKIVNVNMDSGVAMIRDIMKHIV